MKEYTFIIILFLYSCGSNLNPHSQINLTSNQIDSVKKSIINVQKIFEKVESEGITKMQLGYHIYNTSALYFTPYCIGENKQDYKDSEKCNFNKYLSLNDSILLLKSIHYLLTLDISGCHFTNTFNNYIFSIKAEHYREGQMRWYVVPKETLPDKIIDGMSYYKIYDIKDSLFLIGDTNPTLTRPRLYRR
jgi:hypothetical protein